MEMGSNYPAVNERDVRRVAVYAPAKDERRSIAAVLDTVDEAITATEAVIEKLKQARAGLLHDLLTRGLDEHGQLRDPRPTRKISKTPRWGGFRGSGRLCASSASLQVLRTL